jgi:hypothetical protein
LNAPINPEASANGDTNVAVYKKRSGLGFQGPDQQVYAPASVPRLSHDGFSANPPEAICASHLRLAGIIRRRVQELIELSSTRNDGSRPSHALAELAGTLERLQRIERRALDLDDPGKLGPQTRVVIVVPEKLSPKVWGTRASE